jgi:DNA helicase-2/ATP-dependent DNA helicase PcrA
VFRLEASRFISDIQEKNRLPIEAVSIDTEIQTEFTSLFFRERVQPEVGKFEEELVGRLLSKFVMNVSALNNYLKCPLDFYFHNLVRVPCGKSRRLSLGLLFIMHYNCSLKKCSLTTIFFRPAGIY